MPSLRRSIATCSAIGSAFIAAPVVGEFFIKLAEEQGAYEAPSSRLERAMTWLASWTAVSGFDFVAGLVLGLTAGLWLDRALRRREMRGSASNGGRRAPAERRGADDGVTRQGRAPLDGRADYSSGPLLFIMRFGKCSPQKVYLYKESTNLDWVAIPRTTVERDTP